METSDQQYTNEEQLIEDKFQELLNGYLNSNHRKKVEIIERAFKFAKEAHKGIRRRSGEPYILHPIAVARIVSQDIGLGSTSSTGSPKYRAVFSATKHRLRPRIFDGCCSPCPKTFG